MGATQKSLIPVWGGERGCLSKPNGALDGTHAGFGLGGWMTGVLSGGNQETLAPQRTQRAQSLVGVVGGRGDAGAERRIGRSTGKG